MLLYDKSGNFIGVSREELALLGFEDFDEFRSIHTDIAELFLEKPGYIFKFKNFSWIEYVLHSGTPIKVAVLKLKNGKQIEVDIKITEIFTCNNDSEIIYGVKLTNRNSFSEESSSRPSDFSQGNIINSENKVNDFNDIELHEVKDNLIHSDTKIKSSTSTSKLQIDSDIFINDYSPSKDFEDNFITPLKEEVNTELKISSTIKEELHHNLKDGTFDTSSELLKSNVDTENKGEFTNRDNLDKEKNLDLNQTEEEIVFDIASCAQKLDLDLSFIAEIIEEYFKNIDDSISKIESYIETKDEDSMKNKLYELKGIADNLNMNQISEKLQQILKAKNANEQKKCVGSFKDLIDRFKKELL